jgi:Tol biopolymer transport system component
VAAITMRFLVLAARVFVLAALFAVIAGGSSAAGGSFPGKNGVLVFDAVDGATKTVQIFQVSAGGTRLKQLTTTTGAVWNEDPSFSANGRTIYFDSVDRSSNLPGHIYRMNANGTGRRLADRASAPVHVWPSVNRSGSRLAVVQFGKGGRSVVATMKTNGADRRVIARATRLQNNGSPEYAPSGTRLAFDRVTYNKSGQGIAKSDLFVRNGTRNTNITAHRSAKFFGASWAPNGRMLLALRGQRTIVSMRPNGTGLRVLTRVSGAHTGVGDAVYSPNGKKIAYLQCTGDCGDPLLQGQGSIWVMNANGSGKHRVFNGTNGVQPAGRLSWGVS